MPVLLVGEVTVRSTAVEPVALLERAVESVSPASEENPTVTGALWVSHVRAN